MAKVRYAGVVSMGLILLSVGCAQGERWHVTANPYHGVDWETDDRHHGNFHTHTTESDGNQDPADVIDGYHALGHHVLALTDHNKHTWPWQDFGRDPGSLGMIAVPGNELSRHHHTLSLFSDLETETSDHETAVQEVHGSGGISVLAHPGRYWDLDEEGKVPEEVRDRYAGLFTSYSTLVGMEVVNQGDRYPEDRALWDALLTELMPERTVWGMANDDSHGKSQIGLNTTVLFLESFDEEAVRAALEQGRYYFTTVTSHPEDERDPELTPKIRNIRYDLRTGALSAEAESGVEAIPAENYKWISAGEVVHTGPTLVFEEVEGLEKYVRLEIRGAGGTAYTQPFGIERR